MRGSCRGICPPVPSTRGSGSTVDDSNGGLPWFRGRGAPEGRQPAMSCRADRAHATYEELLLPALITMLWCHRAARTALASTKATRRPLGE